MFDRPSIDRDDEQLQVDDLLVALGASSTLEILGWAGDDLERAREDPDLLETLRIAHETLIAIKDGGVLRVFLHLPRDDQANFLQWMGMIDDQELRVARTATFAEAMSQSPLAGCP